MALRNKLLQCSKLYNLHDFNKISKEGNINLSHLILSVRTAKHYDPKFKWLRAKKVNKSRFATERNEQEEQEYIRTKLRSLGILPRYWKSRPFTVLSAHEVMDPYKPPEGDGKISIISKQKIMQIADDSKKKFLEMRAIKKIKSYDSNFNTKLFPQEAQDIYITAHNILMEKDEEKLFDFATEAAVQQMMSGVKNTTIHWKFIESLEPPKVVQVRTDSVLEKTNLFAQITVRFHTKQCLAVYDRFGRLMCGSEILAKDVLEYVVFEKHINNVYGKWRLHAKIIPEWEGATKMQSIRTFVEPKFEEEEEEEEGTGQEEKAIVEEPETKLAT